MVREEEAEEGKAMKKKRKLKYHVRVRIDRIVSRCSDCLLISYVGDEDEPQCNHEDGEALFEINVTKRIHPGCPFRKKGKR